MSGPDVELRKGTLTFVQATSEPSTRNGSKAEVVERMDAYVQEHGELVAAKPLAAKRKAPFHADRRRRSEGGQRSRPRPLQALGGRRGTETPQER